MLNEDQLNLSEKTRTRTLNPISKTGYMDGAADGQAAQFQCSFDMGFHQGLSFGFQLGRVDALSSIQEQHSESQPQRMHLRYVNCEICSNNLPLQQNVVNLFNIQKEKNDDYLVNKHNKLPN